MTESLRALSAVLLGYATLVLANGLFNTLLGLRSQHEGFAAELVGLIMSAFFAGLLLGGRFGARVVARVGHIRAFAAFASLYSATALLHPLWVSPLAWMGFRLLAGFCMAGMVMVTESWVNARAGEGERGQVLSVYLTLNYAAAGCGPLLLGLGDPAEYQLFSLASVLVSLALLPVLLTRSPAPLPDSGHRLGLLALWRIAPLGLCGVVAAGLISATFIGLGPVFAAGIGMDKAGTSLFVGLTLFGGLALQWPLGRASDRYGRGLLIAVAAAGTTLAALAMLGAASLRPSWVLFVAAPYGAFAYTLYSLSGALINDRADPAQRVSVAGGVVLLFGAGASLGPLLGGLLMGAVGAGGLYLFTGGVALALCLFAIWRLLRLGLAPRQSSFVAIPSAQYGSETLYVAAQREADALRDDAQQAPADGAGGDPSRDG